VVRFYLQPRGERTRVFELLAVGPFMKGDRGAGNQFFNSFAVETGFVAPTPGGAQRR
jgi:hypothetical protein